MTDLSNFQPSTSTLEKAFLQYQAETERRKTIRTAIWNVAAAVFFVVWAVGFIILRVSVEHL
jgi:hypothetical protein